MSDHSLAAAASVWHTRRERHQFQQQQSLSLESTTRRHQLLNGAERVEFTLLLVDVVGDRPQPRRRGIQRRPVCEEEDEEGGGGSGRRQGHLDVRARCVWRAARATSRSAAAAALPTIELEIDTASISTPSRDLNRHNEQITQHDVVDLLRRLTSLSSS